MHRHIAWKKNHRKAIVRSTNLPPSPPAAPPRDIAGLSFPALLLLHFLPMLRHLHYSAKWTLESELIYSLCCMWTVKSCSIVHWVGLALASQKWLDCVRLSSKKKRNIFGPTLAQHFSSLMWPNIFGSTSAHPQLL